MAEQLNADLELLLDEEGFDNDQEEMVRIFQKGFTALSATDDVHTTLEQEAKRAASGLRALIPEPKPDELGYFENLWHGMMLLASRVPHNDDRSQMLLVRALQVICEGESDGPDGSSDDLWRTLAQLGQTIRDHWTSPTFQWHPEDECLKLHQWLNLNSWVARLQGAGIMTHSSFALWEIKDALEDDLAANARGPCTPQEAIDNRVAVACEYLIHTAPALLQVSILEVGEKLPNESVRKRYSPGPLFKGGSGFSSERWGFWRRRLGEVRSMVGEDVVPAIVRARESMKAAAVALVESSYVKK